MIRLVVALVAALSLSAGGSTSGETGFGNLGWRTVGAAVDGPGGIVVRPNGRIVVATGTASIVGLLPDGSVDRSFGTKGFARGRRDTCQCGSTYLAVQPNGRLVVAQGQTLERFTSNGRLDRSFGVDGLVPLGDGSASGLAIAPDGGILVGFIGSASVLLRYLPNGTSDVSFGVAGGIRLPAGVNASFHVVVQPDGKIVVAGAAGLFTDTGITPLARYLPDGSPDSTFGTDGQVRVHDMRGEAVALQPDGKILVAGLTVILGEGPVTKVLRVLPDGLRDPSFGTDGIITTKFRGLAVTPEGIAPLPDGTVAVAAAALVTVCCRGVYWFAGRVTESGVWSEGPAPGLIDPEHDCWGELATAVAVQPDGQVLVGGDTCAGNLVGRYTSAFELDRGQPLVAAVAGALQASAEGDAIRISGRLRVGDAAVVSVRVSRTGRVVRLLPGSSLARTRISRPASAITAATRGGSLPLQLLVPSGRSYVVRIDASDDRGRVYRGRVRVSVR